MKLNPATHDLIMLLTMVLVGTASCRVDKNAGPGQEWDRSINFGWKFASGDQHAAVEPGFDDASWESANAAVQTHGGFGFAAEYDIERKFRETRLFQVAPISTNLILSYVAEHVLGLPRSF